MTKPQVLVVEDEEDIAELLTYNLERNGFDPTWVASGEEALKALAAQRPDLVLLDLMLPGMDGLEVCRHVRQTEGSRDLPVVMVTARGEESEVVAGLEIGADDYITKPFSPRVLTARLKAVMRRRSNPETAPEDLIERGELVIHPGRHEATVEGRLLQLTRTEFRILHLLARRPGWVFTRQQIIDAAQGEDVAVTPRSVDVHVVAIRRKLGPEAGLIETVRGVGYRFQDADDNRSDEEDDAA
ncbi:MAG: response regulator transcription factor [Acidobacteriota bacterium]